MLPPAFRPPQTARPYDRTTTRSDDQTTERPPDHPTAAWLAWLDAHRLAPAAARVLADSPLPDHARAHLDAAYAQARAQWLLRKTALQRFLALVNQEPRLPVILLKGAALALTLYDDPATRPMNDIDLLVSPEHLAQVIARMRGAGYEERSLGAGDDVGYLHHFIFSDPATGVRFELHRTLPLLPAGDDALAWFLTQTTPHVLAGQSFLTFTPEAQILHLAAHGVLEHGGALGAPGIWFYDIDQLIRRWGKTMAWEQTIARAQALTWEAALHEAIRLTKTYFATPAPAAIRDWLQLPVNQLSGYNTMRQMTSAAHSTSLIALHILRRLTWRERIRQGMHMLFPSRAYMRGRYPSLPWPAAYPYRWFDAIRKLLPALLWK